MYIYVYIDVHLCFLYIQEIMEFYYCSLIEPIKVMKVKRND